MLKASQRSYKPENKPAPVSLLPSSIDIDLIVGIGQDRNGCGGRRAIQPHGAPFP